MLTSKGACILGQFLKKLPSLNVFTLNCTLFLVSSCGRTRQQCFDDLSTSSQTTIQKIFLLIMNWVSLHKTWLKTILLFKRERSPFMPFMLPPTPDERGSLFTKPGRREDNTLHFFFSCCCCFKIGSLYTKPGRKQYTVNQERSPSISFMTPLPSSN